MGVNSLPKTVAQQHRGCELNPGPSAPESQHANHSATKPATGPGSGPVATQKYASSERYSSQQIDQVRQCQAQ